MPVLLVATEGGEQEIPFTKGASVREILAAGCIHVRSGCGGTGSCGLCLVRIESGAVNDCTEMELQRLRPDEISAGVRFACQVKPLEDLRVAILHPPPHSSWRPLSRDDLPPSSAAWGGPRNKGRGPLRRCSGPGYHPHPNLHLGPGEGVKAGREERPEPPGILRQRRHDPSYRGLFISGADETTRCGRAGVSAGRNQRNQSRPRAWPWVLTQFGWPGSRSATTMRPRAVVARSTTWPPLIVTRS